MYHTMTLSIFLLLAFIVVQNAFHTSFSNRQQRTNTMILMSANFEEPVAIGSSQRGMVRRGLMAAASAVAGSIFLSSSSSSSLSILRPAYADDESQPLGLCASCGSGARGSLTSLCSRCSKGDKFYNPANERIFDTARGSFLPAKPELYLSKSIDRLGGSKIITIGEVHSNPCHHKLEFDIIRTLGDRNEGNLAIGLECFYRQHQVGFSTNYHNIPHNTRNNLILTSTIIPLNSFIPGATGSFYL